METLTDLEKVTPLTMPYYLTKFVTDVSNSYITVTDVYCLRSCVQCYLWQRLSLG